MSVCTNCEARAERACSYTARTREYYRILIPALRYRAFSHGYALAVHGSLKTDIDLIAIAWRDSATSAHSVAEEIRSTAEKIIGFARIREVDKVSNNSPQKKPCGRLAWSFHLTPDDSCIGPYIDLSVIEPPSKETPKKKAGKP